MTLYVKVPSDQLADWPVGTTKDFSGAVTIDGAAVDISGDTVTLRLKSAISDADSAAVVTKSADVLTDGANGNYTVTVDPDDTKAVTPGQFFYDIEWVRADGSEYILDSGTVSLTARVSDVPA